MLWRQEYQNLVLKLEGYLEELISKFQKIQCDNTRTI